MASKPVVLLTTEGTYPFHQGGVSTWCDTLVHRLPDVEFIILAIAMNPYVSLAFDLPHNVQRTIAVPLWGMQDPSEHRDDVEFSEIFLQKQRTGVREVNEYFIPAFQDFLNGLMDNNSPGPLGESLAALYRYFRTYDYLVTFKMETVWMQYKTWLLDAARQGMWPEPSIFEAVQGLGWIYHFLIVLNTPIPRTDLVHSSAAAFCGMPAIISKIEYGTPYVLTEHGVYLREQYLGIGRSNMTPFAKRFMISLVKAVAKENLYWADELAPVCAFNGRWEKVLGAEAPKIRVIYNGVNSTLFHPAEAVVPAPDPHGSSAEPLRILSVARIDPNKDLVTLLHAMAIIKERGIKAQLTVQGSVSVPQYQETLRQLHQELNLGDMVKFSGHTSDIHESYRSADITVQSSVTEAFPYSVLESMMSGVPMVATDVGGTREALGSAGILVPSRDPGRLALGIMMLAQDVELRRRLGREARERALHYFDVKQTMVAFSRLYERWSRRQSVATKPELRSTSAVVSLTRGFALKSIGEPTLALRALQEVLTSPLEQPATIVVLMEMANLELASGDFERGLEYLVKARVLEELSIHARLAG